MSARNVVIDSSVVEDALYEAIRMRGLDLGEFPPADPKNRATSVLESALSDATEAAGLTVRTTDALVADALERVEANLPDGAEKQFKAIEDTLWEQLEPAIDDVANEEDSADRASELGPWTAEAVRVLDADILVTTDPAHHAAGSTDDLVVLTPAQWLLLADSEIRKYRATEAG